MSTTTDSTATTDSTTGPEREPFAAVPLPPGHVPCMDCGVAVSPEDQAATETVGMWSYGRVGAMPVQASRNRSSQVPMSRCPACLAIRDAARDLLAEHRQVAAALGPDAALHRVEMALLALDVLGAPTPSLPTTASLLALIEHLCVPGGLARWAARYSPFMLATAEVGTCSPARWAHLDDSEDGRERREGVREGYGSLLYERTRRPHQVACPSGGCMMCGIASYEALEDYGVWTEHTTRASGLGGRYGMDRVTGHLCPACEGVVLHVGGFGPTSLERALVAYLGVPNATLGAVDLVGVRGWAAMGKGTPPNSRPWAHLAGLEALAAELRAG